MKYLILLPLWFTVTCIFTLASIFAIQHTRQRGEYQLVHAQRQDVEISAPIADIETSGEVKGLSTTYVAEDARPEIVARFLARHKSPMQPHDEYGKKLVEIADKYGMDYRLLPAIAMQESNLCKVIPENSYNCLGFGIHSRGTLRFESYEAAFDTAAKTLKTKYIDIGLDTPEKIMRKYTPSSNGSWANSVNQWIAEMEYDSRELGRELKTDADLNQYVTDTTTP